MPGMKPSPSPMTPRANLLCAAAALCLLIVAQPAPASRGIVAGSTNIVAAAAGGWLVAVSSQDRDDNGHIRPEWQAGNAIDGLCVRGNHTPPNSYGWSTATPPSEENPHWIVLAFDKEPKTHLISRVVIDPVTDDPPYIGRWVKDIGIQVSTTEKDGPYKTVGRYLVVNKAIPQTFDFPPVECRYLRIMITDNHGSDRCVELGEIEVYEAIVGEEELDRLILRLENLLQDLKRYRDGQLYRQQKASLEAITNREPATVAPQPADGG